ncbi:MAG: NAD(P)-dependent oxidoreductase [Acidobacteria bacterium]|nr:NAD(P)-dependent oxidoreductase [Acidobacteriota bacterium]
MALPRLIIIGSSGFVGRHLLDYLKEDFRIVGLDLRSQLRGGVSFHDNVTWYQVDIGERESLAAAFRYIRESGGADYLIHLAAHFDFTGEKHPEYWRTNVDGMRNVLEECRELQLKRFVFASSVAACRFPPPGQVLTEDSPPDGDHVYAVTKRIGEDMLAEYDDCIPSCITRFAALFSDWCEYPPLYFFLDTWLSQAWNSRIIGSRGMSAIPYMHVREMGPFMRRVIEHHDDIGRREVLIASPSATLSHLELFDLANIHFRGRRERPIHMPKLLAIVGVRMRDLLGRIVGNRPFERPWMMRYVDKDLAVNASRTYARLDWHPRERLLLSRRMPFLVEHLKSDPVEWHRLNRAAPKGVRLRDNLRIYRLLDKNLDEICNTFLDKVMGPAAEGRFPSYQKVARDVLEWRFMILLRHLQGAVRTSDRGLFTAYCRDLAEKRLMQGFGVQEVCGAMQTVNSTCLEILREDPEAEDLGAALHDHITMTMQFGCDQILEIYEEVGGEELPEEF